MLVMTTCADADEAGSLASALVEQHLAACVNTVSQVTSTYRWQGRIEQDHECLLIIKTTADRFAALDEAIRARSSYDVPEVVAVPIAAGSAQYLDWLGAAVRAVPGK